MGLTLLHISDWHEGTIKNYNYLPFRDALLRDIEIRSKINPELFKMDFIFFSGDVASHGHSNEYDMAIEHLFDPLLRVCGIGRDRLIIVPGNHDLDLKIETPASNILNTKMQSENEVSDWINEKKIREYISKRFANFSSFVSTYTGQIHPEFANIKRYKIDGKKIAILGINSVAFYTPNSSSNIYERASTIFAELQLINSLNEISDADIKIAVIHNLSDNISDSVNERFYSILGEKFDIILIGDAHQMETSHILLENANYLSAGPLDSQEGRYNFVHIDLESYKVTVFSRRWVENRGNWFADGSENKMFTLKRNQVNANIPIGSVKSWQELNALSSAEDFNQSIDKGKKSNSISHKSFNGTKIEAENYSNDLVVSDPTDDHQKYPIKIESLALTDAWSKIDLLYFSDYSRSIVDFIKNKKNKEPLVIGIDAAWGTGKTTLMHLVEKELLKEFTIKDIVANNFDSEWGIHKSVINQFKKEIQEKEMKMRKKAEEIRNNYPEIQKYPKNLDYTYPTIWFNAWKYDKEKSLLAAMIIEIFSQINSKYGYGGYIFKIRLALKRFGLKTILTDLIKNFLPPIILLIGVMSWLISSTNLNKNSFIELNTTYYSDFGMLNTFYFFQFQLIKNLFILIGSFAIGYTYIKKIYTNPFSISINKLYNESNIEEKIGFIREFEKIFSDVVSIITKHSSNKADKKLIIFIDDLDRCKPPKSAEVIEAINTILDADNCIFIIGMDSKMVELSIESKYKSLAGSIESRDSATSSIGKLFLEKIIQINFRIPDPSPKVFNKFIEETLLYLKGKQEISKSIIIKEEVERYKNLIESAIGSDQANPITLDKAVNEVLLTSVDIDKNILEEAKNDLFAKYLFEEKYNLFEENLDVINAILNAQKYLGPNPRKIKRFINNFRLQALIANRRKLLENHVIDLSELSRLIILEMKWPKLFEAMIENRKLLEQLKSKEVREKTVQEREYGKFKNIIKMEEFIELIDKINPKSINVYLSLANVS
jgi:hypothetical protein